MATDYTISAQQQVSEFVPPNQIRKVMEVTAVAKPSGVIFTFRVPRALYTKAEVAGAAEAFALPLNAAAAVDGVVSIDAANEITPGEVIATQWTVGVESTSGNSSIDITVPDVVLFSDHFAGRVHTAVAQLDAVEAL